MYFDTVVFFGYKSPPYLSHSLKDTPLLENMVKPNYMPLLLIKIYFLAW